MAFEVKFQNGKTATFQSKPTDRDIDEVARSMGLQPSQPSSPTPQQPKSSVAQKVGTGLDIAFGGAKIGEAAGSRVAKSRFARTDVSGGLSPQDRQRAEQIFQKRTGRQAPDLSEQGTRDVVEESGTFKGPSGKELLGDVAVTGLGLAGLKGLGAATRLAKGASVGQKAANLGKNVAKSGGLFAGFGAGQAAKDDLSLKESVGPTAGLAALGGSLPVIGGVARGAVNTSGRLFRALGSGLSGVSGETIETIVKNPRVSSNIAKQVSTRGQEAVLRDNVDTIIKGVRKINTEAGDAFGKELEKLMKVPVKKSALTKALNPVFREHGIVVSPTKGLSIADVEFTSQLTRKRATEVLNTLNKTSLDGKSIRSVLKKAEEAKFKSALTEDKRVFNAFINDFTDGLKTAVSKGSPILAKANARFSAEKQLADEMQSIFGKIKFGGNLDEVRKISLKVDKLFSQSGLTPQEIDKFLTRVGVSPGDFRAAEAARQIGQQRPGVANVAGLRFAEVMQSLTSSVVTPDMVRVGAEATGLARGVVKGVFDKLGPAARVAFVKLFVEQTIQSSKPAASAVMRTARQTGNFQNGNGGTGQAAKSLLGKTTSGLNSREPLPAKPSL